ncbi:thioesterase family protein [Polymorphospora sp. NPDC051019]|uniref:thioesterase family protein n=1 Tax=Polymorphospora sp. NPDC051019 TaxID=3155725 RepID=UPI0034387126
MSTQPDSYFIRIDENRYRPTELTGGAWALTEQHISPMIGLIVHAIDRYVAGRAPDGMVVGRISVDILGVVGLEDFDLHVETVRPGRTIELVEATVVAKDRPAVRARVWRLSAHDTSSVAGGQGERLPSPDDLARWAMSETWSGGYISSLDVRPVGAPTPGRTTAWVSTPARLVAGEPSSTLARFVGLVDTANGIAARQPPTEWLFPNLDLSIHLFRQPAGEWVGLDTTVVFGAHGQGLTSTVLHDLAGPLGHAEQILTVRPARR